MATVIAKGRVPAEMTAVLWRLPGTDPGVLRFDRSPWILALSVAMLVHVTIGALRAADSDPDGDRAAPRLFLAGLILLAVSSANLPTLALTWAAVGIFNRIAFGRSGGTTPRRVASISTWEILPPVLLLGAGAFTGSARWPLLLLAVVAVMAGASRSRSAAPDGPGREGERFFLLLGMGYSALAWAASSADFGPTFSPWIGWAALIAVAVAAGAGWISVRDRAWRVWWGLGLLGASWLGAGSEPDLVPAAIAAAGSVMLLGWGLGRPEAPASNVDRGGALAAALLAAGVPYLVGGVLLGTVTAAPAPQAAVGMIGLGLLGSTFSVKVLFRESRQERERFAGFVTVVAHLLGLAAGVGLYALLHPSVPEAGLVPTAATLATAFAGAVLMQIVPRDRLGRIARALRWPQIPEVASAARSAGHALQSSARAVRDVLEGDASLLWAFVILLVAYLLLGGAP